MTSTIDFYFDFGSPNACLCLRILPGIEARTGAVFTLRPALLGGVFKATNNRSPMEAFAEIPAKLAYQRLEMARFIARHRLAAFRFNPFFPINTLAMMRGAHAAQKLGLLAPYVEAVASGMWEQQRDMGQPDILAGVIDAAGLPSAALFAAAQSAAVKQALIDETQGLVDRGGFGIPTFFVGDAMFFGKDRLRDVEDAYVGLSATA